MNKDLKKRLAELKKPAAAKAAVGALRGTQKILREQAGKSPTDVVRTTRRAALAEHERVSKEAQSATERMTAPLPGPSEIAQYAPPTGDNQVRQSQDPPKKVGKEGGETIGEIVADLEKRAQFKDYTADDLWPHLMGELDRRELHPAEKSNRADIAKSSISYFPPKKPKGYSITLGRFRSIVSDARKKSRLPG